MTRTMAVAALATSVLSVAAMVRDDPAPTQSFQWAADGPVSAALEHNGVLYIGGGFSRVAPVGNLIGALVRADRDTGAVTTAWPEVDRQIWAVEPDASGGVYIGGTFTTVGGVAREYLAHVLPNGTLDPGFAPVLNGPVTQIVLGPTHLFVRGSFAIVNGQNAPAPVALNPHTGMLGAWSQTAIDYPDQLRVAGDRVLISGFGRFVPQTTRYLAAVNEATGALVWRTDLGVGGFINALAVSGNRVIVGGDLRSGTTAPPRNLMSVDLATGAVDPLWPSYGVVDRVAALAAHGSTLYVGGYFTQFGGQARQHAAAVDVATGSVLPWDPRPDTAVTSLVTASDGTVFVGGLFRRIANQLRPQLASFDANGQLRPWIADASAYRLYALAAGPDGHIFVGAESAVAGGAIRLGFAAFDLDTQALRDWAPSLEIVENSTTAAVTTMAARGDTVYASGNFTAVNGVARAGLAAISTSGVLRPWNPAPPGLPRPMTKLLALGDHVYSAGFFDELGGLPRGISPMYLGRLDPETGAVDPAWRPHPDRWVRDMVSDGRSLFIAGLFDTLQGTYRQRLASVDIATGAVTPWRPIIGVGAEVISTLALDGQTLYLDGNFTSVNGLSRLGSAAVDTTSGATLAWHPARPIPYFFQNAMTVADGTVIRAIYQSVARGQQLLHAVTSEGAPTGWQPLMGVNVGDVTMTPAIAATSRYVVATGLFHAEVDPPAQGIAAFARTGSSSPTALRSLATVGGVRLQWHAPTLVAPAGYVIEVGTTPGSSNVLMQPTGGTGTFFDASRPAGGTFYVRVRAQLPGGGTSPPSNEIALTFGCTVAPAPPFAPTVTVSGSRVRIGWSQPGYNDPTHYVIEAGSAPGLRNLARLVTTAPPPFEADAPAGTYWVRVRAANACSESPASPDIWVTVGSGAAVPAAPAWTRASVTPSQVVLTWAPVAGATSYLVEAGLQPTRVDAAQLPVGNVTSFTASGVPAGIYSVRIRAVSAAGPGPPGPEVGIAVP
jgi:hypothetical protein